MACFVSPLSLSSLSLVPFTLITLPSFSLSTPLQHQSRLTYPCRDKHARRALLERKLAEAEVAHDGHEAEARELFLSAIFIVVVVVIAATAASSSSAAATTSAATSTVTRSRGDAATPVVGNAGSSGKGPGERAEREEREGRRRRRSDCSSQQSRERRSRSQRPRRLLQLSASTRRPPRQEAPRRSLAASQHGSGFEFVCGGASFDKFGK